MPTTSGRLYKLLHLKHNKDEQEEALSEREVDIQNSTMNQRGVTLGGRRTISMHEERNKRLAACVLWQSIGTDLEARFLAI